MSKKTNLQEAKSKCNMKSKSKIKDLNPFVTYCPLLKTMPSLVGRYLK